MRTGLLARRVRSAAHAGAEGVHSRCGDRLGSGVLSAHARSARSGLALPALPMGAGNNFQGPRSARLPCRSGVRGRATRRGAMVLEVADAGLGAKRTVSARSGRVDGAGRNRAVSEEQGLFDVSSAAYPTATEKPSPIHAGVENRGLDLHTRGAHSGGRDGHERYEPDAWTDRSARAVQPGARTSRCRKLRSVDARRLASRGDSSSVTGARCTRSGTRTRCRRSS